jgi:hypothetical protein
MDRFPTELIVLVIFAVVTLFQYLIKRLRQLRQQTVRASATDSLPAYATETVHPVVAVARPYKPTLRPFSAVQAHSPAPVRLRRRSSRRALLGNRQELRNAIIMATIIGPCRAFESLATSHS